MGPANWRKQSNNEEKEKTIFFFVYANALFCTANETGNVKMPRKIRRSRNKINGNRKQEKNNLEAKTVAPSTFAMFSLDVCCVYGRAKNAAIFILYHFFNTITIKSLRNSLLYVYLYLFTSLILSPVLIHPTTVSILTLRLTWRCATYMCLCVSVKCMCMFTHTRQSRESTQIVVLLHCTIVFG